MGVGSPLGVLDRPRGVVNQVDIDALLTVGTCAGQIMDQVGDAYALTIRYEGLHDVGRQTYLIHIIGDHVSFLPYYGGISRGSTGSRTNFLSEI